MRELILDRRHQGPFGAVNGGYLAGVLGEELGDVASSVRLHEAVPTDATVEVVADGKSALLRYGHRTIATAVVVEETIPDTQFVPANRVRAASPPQFDRGVFADCFVCGRPQPEGLGVEPSQLIDGRFAALWTPAGSQHVDTPRVPARYLRAALDCPGGFAALYRSKTLAVTGTITSQINFLPTSSETLIVVGEATYENGRKLGAVTTIYTENEEIVATASAVWITLQAVSTDSAA